MAKIFLFIGYIRLTQSRKTKTLFVMQEYLCLHIHGGERTAKSQYFKKKYT